MNKETPEDSKAFMVDIISLIKDRRKDFLVHLDQVQNLRASLLEQEIQRIKDEFGANDSRVSRLSEKLESSKITSNIVNAQLEIDAIKVPKKSENQTRIHGRVTNERLRGIGNLAVSLTTEGKALDEVGKTDSFGYYSIILPSTIVKKLESLEVFVYVYHGSTLVYKSPQALKLTMGQDKDTEHEFKFEIVLGRDELKNIELRDKPKDGQPTKVKKRKLA
jgi:hypothetical protein